MVDSVKSGTEIQKEEQNIGSVLKERDDVIVDTKKDGLCTVSSFIYHMID